jgi:hypothetical protein
VVLISHGSLRSSGLRIWWVVNSGALANGY